MWIRCLGGERLPTASYALRPNLNNLFFFTSEQLGEKRDRYFCRLFSTHQPTTHLRFRYKRNPRSTRFVSGKASEYRWRPPKFHVEPWSRGREVARDVLRSLPKRENAYFLPSEMDRDFLSSVFYTPAVKCYFLRRLAGARAIKFRVSSPGEFKIGHGVMDGGGLLKLRSTRPSCYENRPGQRT